MPFFNRKPPSPEEIAAENLRRWSSDATDQILAQSQHCERLLTQLRSFDTELLERGIIEDSDWHSRRLTHADALWRCETVSYIVKMVWQHYAKRRKRVLNAIEDEKLLRRKSSVDDAQVRTSPPTLAVVIAELRELLSESNASANKEKLLIWLAHHGIAVTADVLDEAMPSFDTWWETYQEQQRAIRRSGTTGHTVRSVMQTAQSKASPDAAVTEKRMISFPSAPRIFIVHGHDDQTLSKVENLLHRIGCKPVTFGRLAGKGAKTNIEILEEIIPTCDAVIALLTPDDEGRKFGQIELVRRARQNVLIEAGYSVISRRQRSIIVAIGGVEIPSDFDGINRVNGEVWNHAMELDLARRLSSYLDLRVDVGAL